MFRGNKVEPTILEEDGNIEVSGKVVPFDSKNDEVEMTSSSNFGSTISPGIATVVTTKSAAKELSSSSRRSSAVRGVMITEPSSSGRRSSSVAYYMDRVQSKLRKTVSVYARRQLFQTQKFFTPFKRWLFGFYDRKFEPLLEVALSDLKDNRSGAWVMHPQTMCCVHIIQIQLAIYRKASLYRLLETYILTGLPMWGTFLFQGCIIYNLWRYLRATPVSSTGFCTNSFLLELSTLVVFIMITVVENTARFEANALVALAPVYGRLPNAKKFDLESGEQKTGMHNLIMKRHFKEFMKSDAPYTHKIIYIFALCSVAFDIWIFITITYVGSKYIATSNGVSNVIQSAVALSFIWSLGDVVFKQAYSDSIVEDLQSVHVLFPTNDSDWTNVEQQFDSKQSQFQQQQQPINRNSIGGLPPLAFNTQPSNVSIGNGTIASGGSSVNGEDENLEEHILFLNNNILYNAFFVVCLVVIPIFVTGVLIPTRIHYCGQFLL